MRKGFLLKNQFKNHLFGEHDKEIPKEEDINDDNKPSEESRNHVFIKNVKTVTEKRKLRIHMKLYLTRKKKKFLYEECNKSLSTKPPTNI